MTPPNSGNRDTHYPAGIRKVGRPTSKDVARHAGVSPQTVSNVLNGRGRISAETQRRVRDSIDLLGYRPNTAAQELRSSKTKQLAYHVLPGQLQARNSLIVDLLRSLIAEAQAHQYRITLFTSGTDTVRSFDNVISTQTADAFLLSDCDRFDLRARYLSERGLPFAALGRTAPDLPQCWVDIDNISAGSALVEQLAAVGHRRIAFLGREDNRYWTHERFQGYLRGVNENALPLDSALLAWVQSRSAPATVQGFLDLPTPPTAIIADSDVLAAAAISAIETAGLSQDDIAVAGFDGGLVEHISGPPYFSVRTPTTLVAERLVLRCLGEIEGSARGLPGDVVQTIITTGQTGASSSGRA